MRRPKGIKTKKSAAKRFKITANGKVKSAQAGKRHRLISSSPEQTRRLRGTKVLRKQDGETVKQWMPYGRKKK